MDGWQLLWMTALSLVDKHSPNGGKAGGVAGDNLGTGPSVGGEAVLRPASCGLNAQGWTTVTRTVYRHRQKFRTLSILPR